MCPEPNWPARQRHHHHHHHRLARQGYIYNKQVNFSARLVPFISQGFLHTHATSRMAIDKKKAWSFDVSLVRPKKNGQVSETSGGGDQASTSSHGLQPIQ